MHTKLQFIIVFLGLLAFQGRTQTDYNIYLQQGLLPVPEMYTPQSIDNNSLAAYEFREYYYVALQFYDVPTAEKRGELASKGIELLDYIPNYAYVAKVPKGTDFALIGTKAIFMIKPAYKLSPALAQADYPAYAMSEDGIMVNIHPYPDIPPADLLESLKRQGFVGGTYLRAGIRMVVDSSRLATLAAHPGVMYMELREAPPVMEGWTGRSSHRVNWLGLGPGEGYDGKGINIAIADDGSVLHLDFKGRITDFNSGFGGNHGDMTAGLAIGAGNLNPLGVGMAPGAHLFLYPIDGYPHIENAVQNLQQRSVTITSTSYGEGCGGFYNQSTQSIDRQVYENPFLMHFFSAGNSGEEACGVYGNIIAFDGSRFGNITGGRKAGKNIITVGNAYYNDLIISNSSRGPAQDGRIKPDIIAHGQGNLSTDTNNAYRPGGGSSAASPALAGTAALLYQAYREANGGNYPSSALIKAALLNTAEDLGNPGPDYISGWGRVHAGRALEVLQNKWFTSYTITNGANRTHTITVPQGTKQMRVMVYWHDWAGLPLAGKALVNDLDIKMITPFGETYRPWVLSIAPHRDSLNQPAYRGIDRVNNMEQITVDEPIPGNYTLDVKGHLIPQGAQSYFLVYHFTQDELTMAYPKGGEGFVPGETEVIRWDALSNVGSFSLEYSTNGGSNWQTIANNIAGHLRHFDWNVPNIVANKVLLRVKRNGKIAVSDKPFCIMQLPDFSFGYISQNTASINWQAVPGANVYDVYALGDKYMEIIGTTSGTSFNFNINTWTNNWFAVRARNSNGATGRRTSAKNYQHRPCEQKVTLALKFDLYPGETFWDVRDANNRVWASGGPYPSFTLGNTLEVEICLPYGCYSLNMYDSYNDGMCCRNGQGSYQLTHENGSILASGSEFGSFRAHNFCLQETVTTAPLSLRISDMQHVVCHNEQNGSASIIASGGSGNYIYNWSNGSTNASATGLSAGNYSVTVTDGASQVVGNIIIQQPTALQVQLNATYNACSEGGEGMIIAKVDGGVAPYGYLWSSGHTTSTISNPNPGTHRLTVTDANGCNRSASITISESTSLAMDITSKNITCYGGNDGEAIVTVRGGSTPYRYAWSTGNTSAIARNLPAGIHSITVTDSQGCEIDASVTISTPPAINMSFNITHAFAAMNGAINLSVSGGNGGYVYEWSNGATTEDLNTLAPGTYTVTVTDRENCTAVGSARIELQNPADCSARGSNTRFEWIDRVQIGTFVNKSGNDYGYGNYTTQVQNLAPGGAYYVSLEPGFMGSAFKEYWRIWVDFNQDGDYLDAGELIFTANGFSTSIIGSMTIPSNIIPGNTTMRISMRYGTAPLPCGTFPYGEVEDYGVVITQNGGLASEYTATENKLNIPEIKIGKSMAPAALRISPNPSQGDLILHYESHEVEWIQLQISDISSKNLLQKQVQVLTGTNEIPLALGHLPSGAYMVRVFSAEDYFVERLIIR